MTIQKLTDTVAKRQHFMMSDSASPPYQVFRYTVDTEKGIDTIERFDPVEQQWVEHDNDYIRDNFFGYKYDLTNIEAPANEAELIELATFGWRARRFESSRATTTET